MKNTNVNSKLIKDKIVDNTEKKLLEFKDELLSEINELVDDKVDHSEIFEEVLNEILDEKVYSKYFSTDAAEDKAKNDIEENFYEIVDELKLKKLVQEIKKIGIKHEYLYFD